MMIVNLINNFLVSSLMMLLLQPSWRSLVESFTIGHSKTSQRKSRRLNNSASDDESLKPKAIIFDLDGCLWKPEMYELQWYGKGAPFTPDGNGNMISCGGDKVKLLGNVREIFTDLYSKQQNGDERSVLCGISSRTDEPTWAKELLQKFSLNDDKMSSLGSIFDDSPAIEISYDSKVKHFQRISANTGIALEDMIFFDNERGNCVEVSKLGVTVVYVPNGVTSKLFQAGLDNFPAPVGQVVNYDIF